ncbi:MAG: LarC family nickel insertion protein [Blautia sp.]|nr:LarC family nickel insertion protein [Blautia sp.]
MKQSQGQALYLECYSGISGDMTVAALLDLGADEKKLREVLQSLPLDGYEIEVTRVNKSGIDACDFNVVLDTDNHDHDMEYLHGHAHEHEHDHDHDHNHDHDHEHDHDHNHDHDHEHDHDHNHEHDHDHVYAHNHGHGHEHSHEADHDNQDHTHSHVHRGMAEIRDIINAGALTEGARALSLHIFEILAAAEAKAHGVDIEQVHFHEVGAVDSIIDIVAAAVCMDQLGITEVIVPKLCEGRGTVRCQHGILPIPVPAVQNICIQQGLLLSLTDVEGELVTPTGAAIAAALKTGEKLPDSFRILRTGIGAGKRTYHCPGILRIHLIEDGSCLKKNERMMGF